MNLKEFELEKKLIELKKKADLEVEGIKHKNHLEEFRLEKEMRIEIQRFKTAGIKRTIEQQANRKGDKEFMENYYKN